MENKKRGKYSKNACVHCHKAHQACTETRPCYSCEIKGLECVDRKAQEKITYDTTLSADEGNLQAPPLQNFSQQAPIFFSNSATWQPLQESSPSSFLSSPAFLNEISSSSEANSSDSTQTFSGLALLETFAQNSRTEMSVWDRKTMKLINANTTFLSNHRLRSGEVVTFYEALLSQEAKALNKVAASMVDQIVDPEGYGEESIVHTFWHKFYVPFCETTMMVNAVVRVEKQFVYFERTKYHIGKLDFQYEPGSSTQICLWEEFQVNDGEVQRYLFTPGRTFNSLILRVVAYIQNLKERYYSMRMLSQDS